MTEDVYLSVSRETAALTVPGVRARKGGEPIVSTTAYTTPMAEIADRHCDVVLVGDSVGMVLHGLAFTTEVTLDMMIMHGRAVRRGIKHAVMVVDMPFGSTRRARNRHPERNDRLRETRAAP